MTSKFLPYDPAEKNVAVVYHHFTETIKQKHVFVAPREAGHWQLWDSFDARENVDAEVKRAKAQEDCLVEVIVTDDDAAAVLKMLHKRSAARHHAGLGPDRTPPLPVPPVGSRARQAVSGLVPAPARATLRGRPPRKKFGLKKEAPAATVGPSQPTTEESASEGASSSVTKEVA